MCEVGSLEYSCLTPQKKEKKVMLNVEVFGIDLLWLVSQENLS